MQVWNNTLSSPSVPRIAPTNSCSLKNARPLISTSIPSIWTTSPGCSSKNLHPRSSHASNTTCNPRRRFRPVDRLLIVAARGHVEVELLGVTCRYEIPIHGLTGCVGFFRLRDSSWFHGGSKLLYGGRGGARRCDSTSVGHRLGCRAAHHQSKGAHHNREQRYQYDADQGFRLFAHQTHTLLFLT